MTATPTRGDQRPGRINVIGGGGEGCTRLSRSDLKSDVHAVVKVGALVLRLTVSNEAAGIPMAPLSGRDRAQSAIHACSHRARGLAYDGPAAAATTLMPVASLTKAGEVPRVDLVTTVTRSDERLWFPAFCPGSTGAIGALRHPGLRAHRIDPKRTPTDDMRDRGLDPEAALQSAPPRSVRLIDICIKQEPVLPTNEGQATINGLRSGLHDRTSTVNGACARSGGVPHDVSVLVVAAVHAMDADRGHRLPGRGDLPGTFGIADIPGSKQAAAKGPGQAHVCLVSRSDFTAVPAADHRLRKRVPAIRAPRSGLRFQSNAQRRSRSVSLFSKGNDRLAGVAPLDRMLSGRGHDAAVFTAGGRVKLFVRSWNGSHCSEGDFAQALRRPVLS